MNHTDGQNPSIEEALASATADWVKHNYEDGMTTRMLLKYLQQYCLIPLDDATIQQYKQFIKDTARTLITQQTVSREALRVITPDASRNECSNSKVSTVSVLDTVSNLDDLCQAVFACLDQQAQSARDERSPDHAWLTPIQLVRLLGNVHKTKVNSALYQLKKTGLVEHQCAAPNGAKPRWRSAAAIAKENTI